MIAMARAVATGALLCVLSLLTGASRVEGASCEWVPPVTRHSITVRTTSELFKAVAGAKASTTIFVEDGEYRLPRTFEIDVADLVLTGASGDPAKVILRGEGMTDPAVGVAILIGASRVTISSLTVGMYVIMGSRSREKQALRMPFSTTSTSWIPASSS